MSLYGSNQKLTAIGPRSSSRPDLSSASFRNDVFVGGNGFHGEYQPVDGGGVAGGGGYTFTSSFSRSSMHGGGYGGQKAKVSMGGGGGGGMR